MMRTQAAIPLYRRRRNHCFFHAEAESSDTVVMPVMVTEVANLEEQSASMTATLDSLSRESAETDA